MLREATVLAVCSGAILLLACSKEGKTAEREQAAAVAVAPIAAAPAAMDAPKYFKAKCAVCHGASGAGDGPGTAALEPKPRAFADAAWQNAVSDEELAKVITDGGVAVGKSPGMPAHSDLKAKPDLLKDLVALIRGFKG